MTNERPKRKATGKLISLKESSSFSNSASATAEDEYLVTQEGLQSDEEFLKPKLKKNLKQSTFLSNYKPKNSDLDLDEFYGNSKVKVIQRNDLKLPPHLNNLIFHPYTPLTFNFHDPDDSPQLDRKHNEISVDKHLLLVFSDVVSTVKSKLDLELHVRECQVYVQVPDIGPPSNPHWLIRRNRRGQFQNYERDHLKFSYDFKKKSLEQVRYQ